MLYLLVSLNIIFLWQIVKKYLTSTFKHLCWAVDFNHSSIYAYRTACQSSCLSVSLSGTPPPPVNATALINQLILSKNRVLHLYSKSIPSYIFILKFPFLGITDLIFSFFFSFTECIVLLTSWQIGKLNMKK